MEKRKKTNEWIFIFIILIIMSVIAATYAFLNVREYYEGTFNVEIHSKGVDVFVFDKTNDVDIVLNEYNFSKGLGHDVIGETDIIPTLETTNDKARICYEMSMSLPDDQVFTYSNGNVPELILDVLYSDDGINYNKLIDSLDITTKTGNIRIPTELNGEEYKYEINTTKNKKKKAYFKARITFVYFPEISQDINNEKSYHASLNANVVEC